jgi:hypothetical protein
MKALNNLSGKSNTIHEYNIPQNTANFETVEFRKHYVTHN